MQIASQIFPFFEISNWAVRLVVLLLILGFPIALILAWAFELKPEGLRSTLREILKFKLTHYPGDHRRARAARISRSSRLATVAWRRRLSSVVRCVYWRETAALSCRTTPIGEATSAGRSEDFGLSTLSVPAATSEALRWRVSAIRTNRCQ
jgi:hypothetical protein